MNSASTITITLRNSMRVLKKYVEDFSAEELLERPTDGCHSIAWQLGHLIASQAILLNSVSPGAAPSLPNGFMERYAKDTGEQASNSPATSPTEFIELFDRVNQAVEATLAKLSDQDLDSPAPERFRERFPSVGHLYILMATHPMMHVGQFVPVRRNLGKPIVV